MELLVLIIRIARIQVTLAKPNFSVQITEPIRSDRTLTITGVSFNKLKISRLTWGFLALCGIGLAAWLTFRLQLPKNHEVVFKNDELSMRIRPVADSDGRKIDLVFNNFAQHDIVVCTYIGHIQVFGTIAGEEVLLSIDPRTLDQTPLNSNHFLVLHKSSETTWSEPIDKGFRSASKIRVEIYPISEKEITYSAKNRGMEVKEYLNGLYRTSGARPLSTNITASIDAPSQSGF